MKVILCILIDKDDPLLGKTMILFKLVEISPEMWPSSLLSVFSIALISPFLEGALLVLWERLWNALPRNS